MIVEEGCIVNLSLIANQQSSSVLCFWTSSIEIFFDSVAPFPFDGIVLLRFCDSLKSLSRTVFSAEGEEDTTCISMLYLKKIYCT